MASSRVCKRNILKNFILYGWVESVYLLEFDGLGLTIIRLEGIWQKSTQELYGVLKTAFVAKLRKGDTKLL